ncbi:MAG: hypothetical protein M3Q09_09525, partial [Gemmatimonadota bacterium]|nr:hypothetical protein [Gemmatimonadota bacterium]
RHAEWKPIPVLDQVTVSGANNGNFGIFVSPGGALVSDRGGQTSALAWIGPNGLNTPVSSELKVYGFPRISPDGQRVAVTVRDNDRQGISIYDLGTKTFVPLTNVSVTTAPEWSRDGKSVLYVDIDEKSRTVLYSHPADGGTVARKIADLRGRSRGLSLAPDQKSVVYVTYIGSQYQLYRLNLDSLGGGKPFLGSSVNSTTQPQISPDGRWIVVTSDESGASEVYVRTYPDPTFRVQISSGGGEEGIWSKDGKTVFYRTGTSEIAARLATSPNLRVVSRDTVIRDMGRVVSGAIFRSTDLGPDGRFLGLVSNGNDFQLVVVPNWRVEMEQRIAASRH